MEQMLIQLMPLFLIFAIFYFLLIRPQQRRAKEHREMLLFSEVTRSSAQEVSEEK